MNRIRRRWTPEEIEWLWHAYPNQKTERLARAMGRAVNVVYQKANTLGMRKSAAYLASVDSGRLSKMIPAGVAYRFQKGFTPWNKGRAWDSGGRSHRTRFQRGHRPHTWRPVGSERVNADGYQDRKVCDDGPPKQRWRAVHVLLWESVNGPLPKGHAVIFKDGDKTHIALGNLECLTRADLMRRNTYHRYPQPIPRLIQLRGALQRQINRREGDGTQDRGLAGSPVRRAGGPEGQAKPDGHRTGQGHRGRVSRDRG